VFALSLSLGSSALDRQPWIVAFTVAWSDSGTPDARPDRSAVQFHTDFAVRRGQQRRAPQQSSRNRRLPQIIPPAKTSTGFSRDLSSAISGFRSLCGRKRRSTLKPSRSSRPAFRNLSLGAGSRFENSGLHPYCLHPYCIRRIFVHGRIFFRVSTGPATLDRCCERNVVAPGEYSKWFFCTPIRLYGGFFRPATARRMPARSAFGGPASVNPAAVIKPSIGPLWPCPASTTSAPSCARSGTVCRIRAR
jgi:hypothetical protein